MKIGATSTDYIGIDVSYLASLAKDEFDELLTYLANGEIDAEKYLKPMILLTESMDEEERLYWLDILPSMNETQIERLMNILLDEHRKLRDLEIKYQNEIKALNEKHLLEWEVLQKSHEINS
eukprot:TRINITY_DN22602_c0_g1_i1.p2 TRINITY_DN22602_c0_g1~~TRINITY_DN22602_c0_g1_i1.p2  ORF type:complete len:122 (-),score=8.77 TRINITY_DN22602_c0_g1_i1:453-818(-)